MKSYRDLQIWQRGIEFSIHIYSISKNFPENEQFGLTTQLKRATTSITLNIAEGWGRGSDKSFANFLKISRGSLYEVETILELSLRLDFIDETTLIKLRNEIEELGKMINGFIRTLEKNNPVINN